MGQIEAEVSGMNETKKLARFASELKFGDLPPVVVKRTEELILDQLGVQLSSSLKPWNQAVYRQVRNLNSRGPSSIVNYGDKVSANLAAFVNGTFGHGFEIDDIHTRSHTHPGCVVVSSALALGEQQEISGENLILAVVTGYEVMCRIGQAVAPSLMMARGHHPTASVGPFGSAAAAGKILCFDDKHMLNAISIAGGFHSGLMEFSRTGGNVKRIYGGLGAEGGLRAALLAAEGLTGPPTVLEGSAGFCKTFADDFRTDEIIAGLGDVWKVLEITYKRYPTDGMIQAPLDAILKLRSQYSIKPEHVTEIIIGTNKVSFGMIDTIVEPKDITSAQFSAPFCMGMALTKGSYDFRDLRDENLSDPMILEIAHKVRLELDEEVQSLYPANRGGRVSIKMRDGTVLTEKVLDIKGSPTNPMTREEVEEKFYGLASLVLLSRRVLEVVDVLRNLNELKNVFSLTSLLSRRRLKGGCDENR